MVTITTVATGTCIWCLVSADGVHAQFTDGLSGFLCKKHFWQALQIRAESPQPEINAPKVTAPSRPSGRSPLQPDA